MHADIPPPLLLTRTHPQLAYIVRLLDANGALHTLSDNKEAAAKQQLTGAVEGVLNHAAALVARLRDSSGYRWADLGALFGRMRAGRKKGGGSGAAATRGPAAAAGAGGGGTAVSRGRAGGICA